MRTKTSISKENQVQEQYNFFLIVYIKKTRVFKYNVIKFSYFTLKWSTEQKAFTVSRLLVVRTIVTVHFIL